MCCYISQDRLLRTFHLQTATSPPLLWAPLGLVVAERVREMAFIDILNATNYAARF